VSEPWTYCPECGRLCPPGGACEHCRAMKRFPKAEEFLRCQRAEENQEAPARKSRICAIVRTDERFLCHHLYLDIDDLADAGSCVVDGRWLRGTLDGVEALVPLADVERIVRLEGKR